MGRVPSILDSFGACSIVRRILASLATAVTVDPAVQSELNQNQRRPKMAQKVIDVVGTSKESFAKAAENAVAEAAKTVRGLKWARVAELEMELDGKKIVKYRTTTKIYFDIEK
jgi:flavin-binding protein dodecin